MHTLLIVIHLLIVIALVGLVLIQKSEGGGLGIGGGSGFMTARGAANTLTRTTAILAAAFFATSLALGILARYGNGPTSILDRIPTQQTVPATSGGTLLDQLNGSVPNSGASTDGNAAPAAGEAAGQPPAAQENAPASSTAPAPGAPAEGTPPEGAAPAGNGSQSQIPTGQ